MSFMPVTRRDFSLRLAALVPGVAVVGATWPQSGEITHTSDAIHQEVAFKASPARVYAALTDATQFDKVVHLSDAMKAGVPPGTAPTAIAATPGGAFSLFGGQITGRLVELVTNRRIVAAWRSGSWPVGAYSIARFELTPQGAGTRVTFDHTGFPAGEAQHLATGWHLNYWEPLHKYLGEQP